MEQCTTEESASAVTVDLLSDCDYACAPTEFGDRSGLLHARGGLNSGQTAPIDRRTAHQAEILFAFHQELVFAP